MSWSNITGGSTTWSDIPTPDMLAAYVTDQNEDIMTSQDGTPIETQESVSSTAWTDIT